MSILNQTAKRPRLACEITLDRVIAARASDHMQRLDAFTSRKLNPGVVAPGLNGPNVLDGGALRAAISSGLASVAGKSRDLIVILPDAVVEAPLMSAGQIARLGWFNRRSQPPSNIALTQTGSASVPAPETRANIRGSRGLL